MTAFNKYSRCNCNGLSPAEFLRTKQLGGGKLVEMARTSIDAHNQKINAVVYTFAVSIDYGFIAPVLAAQVPDMRE